MAVRTMFAPTPSPYLITAAEAARLLGCRPVDVVELCRTGELAAGRIGDRWLIRPATVRQYATQLCDRANQ